MSLCATRSAVTARRLGQEAGGVMAEGLNLKLTSPVPRGRQDRKDKNSFFNYFYLAINLGSLLAVTVVVYVQDSVRRPAWSAGRRGRGCAAYATALRNPNPILSRRCHSVGRLAGGPRHGVARRCPGPSALLSPRWPWRSRSWSLCPALRCTRTWSPLRGAPPPLCEHACGSLCIARRTAEVGV
jgi:hypothetical protein